MNTLTNYEIAQLPLPPQEWIDDINEQEIDHGIKILQEYCYMDDAEKEDNNFICFKYNIHRTIQDLMELNIKQLKNEINRTKTSLPGFFDYGSRFSWAGQLKLKQLRNGKITKKGLVKNLITSYYEILVVIRGDSFNKCENYKKVIEYLVDLEFDDKGL